MKKEPIGLDLVHFTPDYTKSPEENLKMFREAYRAVYGEYPPPPSKDGDEEGTEVVKDTYTEYRIGETPPSKEEMHKRKEEARRRLSRMTDEEIIKLVKHPDPSKKISPIIR